MNEHEEVIEVRSVRGRITDSSGAAIPRSLFELRIENPEGKVRGALTGNKGNFHIPGVPQGEYVFKATRDGFQSVFGKIKVSKKAKPGAMISLALQHGV